MAKMKVLHICTTDGGGAGLCALRIHEAMLKQGIDSKVLVLIKRSDRNDVIRFCYLRRLLWRSINRMLRILHLEITDYNYVVNLNIKTGQCFTLPDTIYDVLRHPLVKEADVIHLQWVNGFIDYGSFFKKVKKPIIWTQHDENLFLGIAHYQRDRHIGGEKETLYYHKKKQYIGQATSLGIVFLSKMMYEQYHDHEMIQGKKTVIINNSVDHTLFRPTDRSEARRRYGLNDDDIVFAFVAERIEDTRKGLMVLVETVAKLANPKIKILAVGKRTTDDDYPQTVATGPVYDTECLSAIYSCADYFAMPSLQEAFAQTPLEAMACGTPAIVFPVSGTEELINEVNGVRCDGFTALDLENGIRRAMEMQFDRKAIRNDVIERYSPDIITRQYLKFYSEIIKDKKNDKK